MDPSDRYARSSLSRRPQRARRRASSPPTSSPPQTSTSQAALRGTSSALAQSLLKSTTSRAGHRYTPPLDLRERLAYLASQQASQPQPSPSQTALPTRRFNAYAWTAACAALLLFTVSIVMVQRNTQRTQSAALVTEVSDQHIATLAANAPPQVISSDRHTVKPWFQGKIPFSFNLPQALPADTTLVDGATTSPISAASPPRNYSSASASIASPSSSSREPAPPHRTRRSQTTPDSTSPASAHQTSK